MNTFNLNSNQLSASIYGEGVKMNNYSESDLEKLKSVAENQLLLEDYIGKNIIVSFLNVGLFNNNKQETFCGRLDEVYKFDKVILKTNNNLKPIEFAGLNQLMVSIEDEKGNLLFYNSNLDKNKDKIDSKRIFESICGIRRNLFGNMIANAELIYFQKNKREFLFYPRGIDGWTLYSDILKPYIIFPTLERRLNSY